MKIRMTALDNAVAPTEMDVPGWHFHTLTGDMKGRFSVRVTGNWRLTFAWDGDVAIDVDYEDYH